MLVLTRKLTEQIRIGENVVVTVLRVNGHAVRLGIEAPKEVPIVRGELPRFDDADPSLVDEKTEGNESSEGPESAASSASPSAASGAASPSETASDDAEDPDAVASISPVGRSLAARVAQCVQTRQDEGNAVCEFDLDMDADDDASEFTIVFNSVR